MIFNIEMTKIKLSGQEFPIRCDLAVLEKIQNKYNTVQEFEEKINIFKIEKQIVEKEEKETVQVKMPDFEAVEDALFWFIEEAEEITAEKEGREKRNITKKNISALNDMNVLELAQILKNEFARNFKTKK